MSESLCADGRCKHPQGWHRHGKGSCLECGCTSFARLPFKARRLGRLIVTSCRQPAGAPFFDSGYTRDQHGREYASKSLLLTPWRKNEYGEHVCQRALTVGWSR